MEQMKITDTEFVVFDVETTGLSALDGDRIIEIAGVKIKNLKAVEEFSTFINPRRDVPIEAQNIHGITNEMIQDAPSSEDYLPKIIDFIGGACLVGHNISFDLKFLCYELSLAGRKLHPATPAVDTLKMARKLIPYLSNYRLGHLANSLGVKVNTTHRALDDVKLTSSVLIHLLQKATKQYITNFPELYKQFGVEKPNYPITQISQEMLF